MFYRVATYMKIKSQCQIKSKTMIFFKRGIQKFSNDKNEKSSFVFINIESLNNEDK